MSPRRWQPVPLARLRRVLRDHPRVRRAWRRLRPCDGAPAELAPLVPVDAHDRHNVRRLWSAHAQRLDRSLLRSMAAGGLRRRWWALVGAADVGRRPDPDAPAWSFVHALRAATSGRLWIDHGGVHGTEPLVLVPIIEGSTGRRPEGGSTGKANTAQNL